MGRESLVKKDRICKNCNKQFLNLTAIQIAVHAFACNFEQRTGIEIIRMEPQVAPVEPLIVVPE